MQVGIRFSFFSPNRIFAVHIFFLSAILKGLLHKLGTERKINLDQLWLK